MQRVHLGAELMLVRRGGSVPSVTSTINCLHHPSICDSPTKRVPGSKNAVEAFDSSGRCEQPMP